MSPADWIILALVVLNVVSAAMQGFFAEALSMAGLIVGYIVAAWQYQHLSLWLESFLKNEWLAEILGFLIIFFAIEFTAQAQISLENTVPVNSTSTSFGMVKFGYAGEKYVLFDKPDNQIQIYGMNA